MLIIKVISAPGIRKSKSKMQMNNYTKSLMLFLLLLLLLLLFSNLDDVSGAVTADIAAVIGFSSVTDCSAKLATKFASARIAVDAELPTLIVVSGDGDDVCCFSVVSVSPGEFPVLLICFDTCWIILVDGLPLRCVFFRYATALLSLPCCVWNVFFLAELFSVAWFESELSDLQYSCWSPARCV